MENSQKLRKTAYFAVVWVLVALIAISGGTYAWFTFYATTNVTPIHGTIGGGKAITIANNPSGPFDVSCDLAVLSDEVTLLEPVSTADMRVFYAAAAQSKDGITDLFYAVENPYNRIMHGFVYIRSEDDSDVYFMRDGFEVGGSPIVWASGRLGMRITTSGGTVTRVFALDDLGDTSGAASLHTINGAGVISGIDNGYAAFSPDPSESLAPYFASGDRLDPTAGQSRLFSIGAGETVTVEYFVWLEGCDDNCLEGVTGDMSLELAFAGV